MKFRVRHYLPIKSLNLSIIVDVASPDEILLVFLYLRPLVKNVLYLLFSMIWQNGIVLKKDLSIGSKFIKNKYFRPD